MRTGPDFLGWGLTYLWLGSSSPTKFSTFNMALVFVLLCSIFIGIGGFMWGYEAGSINGVKEMQGFRETFNISFTQETLGGLNVTEGVQCGSEDDVETSALLGTIVSVLSIGAIVGALVSGLLSDLAGRKVSVIIGASTCAVGGTLQASSFYLWMLLPGRIVSGIGIGILLQTCPLYIAEIAPKQWRGAMVSIVGTFIFVATLTGVVINIITERYLFGWRISLFVQVIVSIILIFGTIFLPETPRHKDAKAFKVLKKIYKDDNKAQDEFESIKLSLQRSTSKVNRLQKLKYYFNFSILQRVFIGFTLMLLARAAGPAVIVYYSVAIFCKLGVDGFLSTVVLFSLMLIVQIGGIFLVDKCGRKSLLLLGAVVLGLSLISSAALIQIFDLESESDLSVGRSVAGYIVVALICIMMCINNISYGSVVWVVLSEIYPLRIRGVGAALGQLGWWGGTFLMGEISPVLISSPLRTFGTFYLLSGMCLLAFLHVLLLLPETKGQSLEDIEVLFTKSWLKRTDVFYYLRCGCFCCFSRTRQVQVNSVDSENEELQEQLDQISLSSVDSIESVEELRTKDSTL